MSDSATPWTVACQAPVRGISQARTLELPFSSPGDLSDPGIEPSSPALAGRFSTGEPEGYVTRGFLTGQRASNPCIVQGQL